jgi:hypothetical protein
MKLSQQPYAMKYSWASSRMKMELVSSSSGAVYVSIIKDWSTSFSDTGDIVSKTIHTNSILAWLIA